ncbi:MAG: hypothetical protein ACREMB_23760 [Candidatus Rokuibacteriota bacterium]
MTGHPIPFPLTEAPRALPARARELADGAFRERAARWDAREEYPWENFLGRLAPRPG